MGHRDHYAILGVPRDAEPALIQATYWRLAHQCKAALTSDPEAPRLLRELNAAYEVLSTPQLRRQYDGTLARAPVRAEAGPRPRSSPLGWLRRPLGDGKEKPQAEKAGREPEPEAPPKAEHLESSLVGGMFDTPPDSEADRDESQDVREAAVGSRTGVGASSFLGLFPGRLRRLTERLTPRAKDPHPLDEGGRAAALRDSTAAIVARWRQSVAPADGQSWPPPDSGALQPPVSHPPLDP
jgi:curved DNA-binding protein CbpA